jgi:hypothetical protein
VRFKYFPDDPDANESYFKQKRSNGNGKIRIGKVLKPREDMYQLLVISNFRQDLIEAFFERLE